MKSSLPLILVTVTVLMLISAPAFAYIDPGTGSMVIQAIIATVIGASVAGKLFWNKIKAFFTGKPVQDDENDNQ